MTSPHASAPSPEAEPPLRARPVAVLLDAPRPERVPPRLAEDVGPRHALRLLRVAARRTLASVHDLGWAPVVWFGPPDAELEMRRWLGDGLAFRPRPGEGPAATVAAVAGSTPADQWWLVLRPAGGGLTLGLLADAAVALAAGHAVLGATTGGDLYLLGGGAALRPIVPLLPWGERDLAAVVRARLREAGIPATELATLHDLESGDAARASGLLT